ncbi:MAG: hypothetical protein ACI97A_002964 [Planctomycetota bacterium]|jgi:hypothetical protein
MAVDIKKGRRDQSRLPILLMSSFSTAFAVRSVLLTSCSINEAQGLYPSLPTRVRHTSIVELLAKNGAEMGHICDLS